MNRLPSTQLQEALKAKLPSYNIRCKAHSDGTLSVEFTSPESAGFAVTGIVANDHLGPQGVSRLARQIVEDMALARQGSKTARVEPLDASDMAKPVTSKLYGR